MTELQTTGICVYRSYKLIFFIIELINNPAIENKLRSVRRGLKTDATNITIHLAPFTSRL